MKRANKQSAQPLAVMEIAASGARLISGRRFTGKLRPLAIRVLKIILRLSEFERPRADGV